MHNLTVSDAIINDGLIRNKGKLFVGNNMIKETLNSIGKYLGGGFIDNITESNGFEVFNYIEMIFF